MKALLGDLRQGARRLASRPGFTAVALLALAVGIGANSAIYSVADALLFHPLLLPDPDRLVFTGGVELDRPSDLDEITPPDFLDWREQTRTLEHYSASSGWSVNITGEGEPELLRGYLVTASFFDTVAAAPQLGRGFLKGEDEDGRQFVAVLSHPLWQRRFGGDRNVLGRTVKLNGRDYEVVGVMPESVRFPADAEIWAPLVFSAQGRVARGAFYLRSHGRLKPGVTLEEADAEFQVLARRVSELHPKTHARRSARVALARDYVSGNMTRQFTLMLMGGVAFLLLIACSNVANLQFARLVGRSRELALRSALGAGRWRLARLVLSESLLLGLGGGAAGTLFALWGADIIRRNMPAEVEIFLPGWQRIGLSGRVLLFTIAAGVAAGALAGILAAIASTRVNLNDVLKEGGRGGGSGTTRHRVRTALVVAQIVLAMVLLAGGGLMIQGYRAGIEPIPNLEPERIFTMRTTVPPGRYPEPRQVATFAEKLLAEMRAMPGAEAVGLITNLPYSGSGSSSSIAIEGRPDPPPGVFQNARRESIAGEYFRAMRIPLRAGRAFRDTDGENAPLVAVVNDAFVAQYLTGEDPLGKRIRIGGLEQPWITIAGVVGNIQLDFTHRTPRPMMYRPMAQAPTRFVSVAARTTGDPLALARAARAAVRAIDADQPVSHVSTMQKVISDSMVGPGYVASLMGVFGAIALVLSAIGIYSLMSYSVEERTHELGVRIALGASVGNVVGLTIRRGLSMVAAGLVVGLAAAIGMARLLADLIFGVGASDVTALGGVAVLLGLVALLACYVPARRATRVDPMIALRHE